jgi:hypothetical protein
MKSSRPAQRGGSISSAGTFSLSSVNSNSAVIHIKKVSGVSKAKNSPTNENKHNSSTIAMIDNLHLRIKEARERRAYEN